MNQSNKISYLKDGFTLVLIIVFTYTAVAKLTDFHIFRLQMLNQPLPAFFNNLLIWVLPPVELLIALLLLFERTRLYALLGSIILMIPFTGYVALMVLNVFERVPCSCGGILQSLSWGEHLIVNIILLLFSYIAFILEKGGTRKITMI